MKKTPNNSIINDARISSMVRLISRSEAYALNTQTIKSLKQKLNEELNPSINIDIIPHNTTQIRSKQKAIPIEPENNTKSVDSIAKLELELRSLIKSEAKWENISRTVWALFSLTSSNKNAAHIVELAALTANIEKAYEELCLLKKHSSTFYFEIHKKVRFSLILYALTKSDKVILMSLLYPERNSKNIIAIERLFLFLAMYKTSNNSEAYEYFQNNGLEITAATQEYGHNFSYDKNKLYLCVAELAIDLRQELAASKFLEKIDNSSDEYNKALELHVDIITYDSSKEASCEQILKSIKDLEQRVDKLEYYFNKIRTESLFKSHLRLELNAVLKNIFSDYNKNHKALKKLSHSIVKNRDLVNTLPALFDIFTDNALKFHKRAIDLALWSGFISLDSKSKKDKYWQSVALLHKYIIDDNRDVENLFKASSYIKTFYEEHKSSINFTWSQLYKSAQSYVARSFLIKEEHREQIQRNLNLSVEIEYISTLDIADYIKNEKNPSRILLNVFKQVSIKQRNYKLNNSLIITAARNSNLTNTDLNNIWKNASLDKNYDLAWRAASVLKSRQALSNAANHALAISGESRKIYSLQKINYNILGSCLTGLNTNEQKLITSIITIGMLIPELLLHLDPQARCVRKQAFAKQSIESNLERLLNKEPWFNAIDKTYSFSYTGLMSNKNVPGFAKFMPICSWTSILSYMVEQFGLNSWNWKLSFLNKQITSIATNMAYKKNLQKNSTKIARWIKKLTPEQHQAWNILLSLSKNISDSAAQEVLGLFLCKVSTLIYQNHEQSLSSLKDMRASLTLNWQFESWLLSDNYSQIRRTLNTASNVPVPQSLIK